MADGDPFRKSQQLGMQRSHDMGFPVHNQCIYHTPSTPKTPETLRKAEKRWQEPEDQDFFYEVVSSVQAGEAASGKSNSMVA